MSGHAEALENVGVRMNAGEELKIIDAGDVIVS